ncbi:hypothetical protein D3C73_1605970 [compost metagenome]
MAGQRSEEASGECDQCFVLQGVLTIMGSDPMRVVELMGGGQAGTREGGAIPAPRWHEK